MAFGNSYKAVEFENKSSFWTPLYHNFTTATNRVEHLARGRVQPVKGKEISVPIIFAKQHSTYILAPSFKDFMEFPNQFEDMIETHRARTKKNKPNINLS
jgi:hypothetical protein